jgi:hypothetical protein
MPSPITEQAIEIIEAAPADGPLGSADYADRLRPEAGALARLLRGDEIVKAAAEYRAADARAATGQTWFRGLGQASAYSGFAAAALGGVLLYLGAEPSQETLRANLGLAQFALLALSLFCAFALFVSKPYRTWRTERGKAEAVRLRMFALIVGGRSERQDGEAALLPLQLECFRRHLLDDQRKFFARRGPQQRRIVWAWKVLGIVSLLFVLAASAPQLLRLEYVVPLPEIVRALIERVPLDQKGYALVGLLGGSLQGLVAALAVISPAQRNAERYQEMRERLDRYAQVELDKVRADAAAANAEAVRDFARRVSDDLAEEGKEWLLLHQVLSEMALGQLARQPRA